MTACFIKVQMKKSKGRQSSKMEVTIVCNLIMEETPITFVKSYPLEASYLVHPTLRRGVIGCSPQREKQMGMAKVLSHITMS